jgi:hypothetical protein
MLTVRLSYIGTLRSTEQLTLEQLLRPNPSITLQHWKDPMALLFIAPSPGILTM